VRILIFEFSFFQSEKVATAFYNTDWYNQTPRFKRLLPIAIMRASKPVKVKAGVFYDLSFVTFAKVCWSG
jgi:7tm Odorant receptor.